MFLKVLSNFPKYSNLQQHTCWLVSWTALEVAVTWGFLRTLCQISQRNCRKWPSVQFSDCLWLLSPNGPTKTFTLTCWCLLSCTWHIISLLPLLPYLSAPTAMSNIRCVGSEVTLSFCKWNLKLNSCVLYIFAFTGTGKWWTTRNSTSLTMQVRGVF